MEIHELVIEMKLLERRLTLYEEKYGILSEDFYAALISGQLAHYDEYDETRGDFSRWKGIYETWLRRKQTYTEQIKQREVAETLRYQPYRIPALEMSFASLNLPVLIREIEDLLGQQHD